MNLSMPNPVQPTEASVEEPMVRFRGVTKRYGDLTVLDHLDLDVPAGEKVAIIGPSGSGKSTLLRALMTLETIDGGVIMVDGEPLTHMPGAGGQLVRASARHQRSVRGKVGMVFQSFNLFPHMSVLDNCTLAPMSVRGLSRKEAEERARFYLNKVGIESQANKYPSQLSGGQQQRVAIARALCMKPKIMLFDEPTSALDPELVGEVLATIRGLAEERRTMVIVTHEMSFARDVADRAIFIDDGVIVEQGDARQLLSAPQHERTRQFLSKFIGDHHGH